MAASSSEWLDSSELLSPSWPSLGNILPELKTVLPNASFVIEGYVDSTEPLRDEGAFGDHTGYYTLPEPYPVFHVPLLQARCAKRTGLFRGHENIDGRGSGDWLGPLDVAGTGG